MSVYNTIINNEVETSEYYTYDSSGRLTQVVDESGNITKYIYDDSGNLTSLYFEIDGKSSTTNYTYNECFLYDENDACIQTSSLYDNTEYDSASGFDVLKDYHYEDEALYRLEYINLTWGSLNIQQNFVYSGNTTRINQITYDLYDGENPDGINYKYTYTYDSLGNIIHEYYYEATTLKLYRNYEYDALNQLVVEDSRDYNYGSTTLSATNYTKYYYYDSHGNRTDVKTFLYGQNDIITPTAPSYYQSNSGLYDAYMLYNGNKTYQNMYLLNVGQTPSLSFSYYDALYDPDHEYPISGMTTTMTYDNLNTSETGYYYRQYTATDGVYYTISFRIIFKVGTPLPYDRIPQEHLHYNYSSNWEDQLLSYGEIEYINGVPQTEATLQQYTYDNQGNPTYITNFVYNGTTYYGASLSWSGRELTAITIVSQSAPLYWIRYVYNDQGYRTSKSFYTFSGYTPVLTEMITYELIDDKVIYETNGTYGILFTYDYDGTLISFNYDSTVNDQYAGSEYFYIRNQMGDISHIVDSSGAVVVHYVYDAYGNIIYQTPNQTIGDINPYRYRGYRYDEELSWYYLNSRYYTPEVGRFLNADGLVGEVGQVQSTNMFAYSVNNPITNIDPSGYFSWRQVGVIAIYAAVTVAVIGLTVLTLGAAAAPVVLAASAIGAGVGVVSSAITQLATTGTVEVGQLLLDGLTGAMTACVSLLPIGVIGVATFGGVIGGMSYAASSSFAGNEITTEGMLSSIAIGFASGLISGGGYGYDNLTKYNFVKSAVKNFVSPKKIAQYAAKTGILYKEMIISAVRFAASMIFSEGANYAYQNGYFDN